MIVYGEHRYRIQCVRLAKVDLTEEDEGKQNKSIYIFFSFPFVDSMEYV
jgi:hypothetical protein